VHVTVAVVVVAGLVSVSRSAREGFPSISMPRLLIRAELPGASARDVETKVTLPLEEAIDEVDAVDSYYTEINDNLSVTTVELYEDLSAEEIDDAEQDLRQAIDGISDFPPEMEDDPVLTRLNPGKFPIVEIALSGPLHELPIAARRIERAVRRLPDVAQVSLVGLHDPEVRILLDPSLALEHGVTLLDVIGAIERRNVSSTGGVLETEADRRQVVLWSRFSRPEEVGETVLRFLPGGGALRVSDVARIEVGREDRGLLAHTNGSPGVSLVVEKQERADILAATDTVIETTLALPLPPGVDVTFVNDGSYLTRNRLEVLTTNGMMGATLVAGIIFVFLSPGTALWVIVGVPVVILGVLALMPALDMTINMIATAGFVVVLGMLVDDAVVVSERILRRRQQGLSPVEAAVAGTTSVARPVIASAITTMLAFCPMLAIGGMPGRLIWYIPAVVVLALLFSLLESFLILPSHMSMARTAKPVPKRAFVQRLEGRYERLMRWVLPRRYRVLAGFVALFLFTMIVIRPQLGFVLFPQDDADAISLKVSTPVGTPLERTEGIVASLEEQLLRIVGEDLLAVTARIGHQDALGVTREVGASENEGLITAYLLPRANGRKLTAAEWSEALKHRLQLHPSATVVYEISRLGPPIGRPVTIHVASNDDELRRGTAAALLRRLSAMPAIVDAEVDERPGTRQIDLNPDYEKLALRGLDAEDVARTLKAAFFGLEASELRDLDDTTSYRVMFDPSARRSLAALLETPVRNRRGELVRLRDVVQPIEVPSVSRFYHREGLRTATVTADFAPGSGETAGSFAAWIEEAILPTYAGQADLEVYLGGEVVETRKTTRDLGLVAVLSLVGICVVIALMLESFLEAAFVVSVVPFAVVGVLITFFVHGKDLSMLAMVGTIGLAGVVVNASIVMVDAVHQRLRALESDDPEARQEAVIEALVARLRPVLVTSLSTLVGVLPTAYGIGGYDAILSPMSLALGWGLAFSTLITLLLVPSLYSIAGDLRLAGARLVESVRRPSRARPRREGSPATDAAPGFLVGQDSGTLRER
jgi:multidrug efflux pump subunit AcrB